jgi:outer membrane protein
VLGGGVDVKDDLGLGFSGTYFFSKHLGLEVLAALPFSHDIVGTGALNGLDIGSTKHLPPTISLQYYPLDHATVQPYVGLGLNYTTFFEEDTSSALDAALSGRTSMTLDDSTGIAYQLGIDWQLNAQWALNLAVWKVDIDTTADIKLNGAHAASVDVNIDPIVVMAGMAFRW